MGELVRVGYRLEDFVQEVGVVSAAGFEEELFWGGALDCVSMRKAIRGRECKLHLRFRLEWTL